MDVHQTFFIVCLLTVPRTAPQNVTIDSVEPQGFNISWMPPADDDRNGIITYYTISITDIENNIIITLNQTDTQSTVSSLTPFTRYEVKVAAHTSVGRGPFSAIQTLQTQETGIY